MYGSNSDFQIEVISWIRCLVMDEECGLEVSTVDTS